MKYVFLQMAAGDGKQSSLQRSTKRLRRTKKTETTNERKELFPPFTPYAWKLRCGAESVPFGVRLKQMPLSALRAAPGVLQST
jgi:hypothetical protein